MASGTIVQYFHNNKYSLNLAWSESESSVANNTSKVTVIATLQSHSSSYSINSNATKNISITINGVTYSGTCTVGISGGATKTLFTASHTVTHNSDGNKSITISAVLGIAVTLSGTYYSSVNATGIATLSMIARAATITSAPNFNDEETPTITYNNPAGYTVNTWLEIEPTNTHLCIRENIGSSGSYTYELTDEERTLLRKCCTKDSTTIRFGMYTFNGSTLIGTDYKDRTFTIINGTPTILPTVEDVNEKTFALTGDPSILVRNHSNALVDSGAQVYKDAVIAKQKVICGNKSLNDGSGTIEAVGSGAFIFSVTDNRENTVSQTVNVPLIEYISLSCNLNANAPDAEGDMTFTVSGNCFSGSFGSVNNSVKIYYRYKANNDEYGDDWAEVSNVVMNDDNTYIVEVSLNGLNYQNKYTFQAMAVDSLMEVYSVERVVKTTPVFDWGEHDFNFNVPVHLSGVPLLDIFYPVGSIIQSTEYFDPGDVMGGEWEQLKDRFLLGAGDTYESGKTGGKSSYTLSAAIGATNSTPSSIGYIAGNSSAYTNNHEATYTVYGSSYSSGGTFNHTTPVTEHNANSRDINIMPPYLVVYMWKRIS